MAGRWMQRVEFGQVLCGELELGRFEVLSQMGFLHCLGNGDDAGVCQYPGQCDLRGGGA
ncbi:MAG: hypothetical protein JWQ73_3082, partial [Variovorax sp.]|nr:hypothetical protein [Variovorax sp.]